MAYLTVQRELVDPDYHDGIVRSRVEDLLFQNLVGRIKGEPIDWEQKVQVKKFPRAYNAAVAEGGDFDKNSVKEYDDFKLAHVMQIFRSEGYRVSRHREKMPGHNDKKGRTAAEKRVEDAQNLALSLEVAALSTQEAVEYGTTKKPIMRGAACWLKPIGSATTPEGVHAVYPIPLPLVPTAGFDGDVRTLTEAMFKAEVIKAKKQRGTAQCSLVGIVGIDFKSHMSGWLAAATNINQGNIQRTQPASEKTLQLICDDFVFDGCRVHVMNDDHVMNDVDGIPFGAAAFDASKTYAVGAIVKKDGKGYTCKTAITSAADWDASKWEELVPGWTTTPQSYMSGIFIDPTMWGFATLDPITHHDIVDEGGGPGGWPETTTRLTCLNPMGQFRVMHTA